MIGKLLCGALALAFSAQARTVEPRTISGFEAVKQVDCTRSKGSAFRVRGGRMVSVDHVTSNIGCEIEGRPITAVGESGLDFSIIDQPNAGTGFPVNCDGFIPGRYYFAVGYARGWKWQTMVMLLATYVQTENGYRLLLGDPTVIPGMSGGPILDEHGAVVGTVNAYTRGAPFSFSRELKDSSLCR